MLLTSKDRINKIQSLLAGASEEVYIEVAKYLHTEAVICLFDLPCCKPVTHLLKKNINNDDDDDEKVVPPPVGKKDYFKKFPLKKKEEKPKISANWVLVKDAPDITFASHPISKKVIVGSHVQIASFGFNIECIVKGKGSKNVTASELGKNIKKQFPWEKVVKINLNAKKHAEKTQQKFF